MKSDELFQHLKPLIYYHRIFGCFDTKSHSKLLFLWKLITIFCIHLPAVTIVIMNVLIMAKPVKVVTIYQTTRFLAYSIVVTIFLLLLYEIMISSGKYKQIFKDIEELVWKFQNDHNVHVNFSSFRYHCWLLLAIINAPLFIGIVSHLVSKPALLPSDSLKINWIVFSFLEFEILISIGYNKIMMWLVIFLEVSKVLDRIQVQSNYFYHFSEVYESLYHLFEKLIRCLSFLSSVIISTIFMRIVLVIFLHFNLELVNTAVHYNIVNGKI